MDLFDTPKPVRTGSYPFKDIAEDFGLRYGDVLIVAEAETLEVITCMSDGRRAQRVAAIDRIYDKLAVVAVHDLADRITAANLNMKRLQAGG